MSEEYKVSHKLNKGPITVEMLTMCELAIRRMLDREGLSETTRKWAVDNGVLSLTVWV